MPDDVGVQRKMVAILRVLVDASEPVGAQRIGAQLQQQGLELSERAIRYHLKTMDERGLTEGGKAGRVITEKGRAEFANALVSDKVGFVVAKIDQLAYRTTFDLDTGSGDVIVNVSLLPTEHFEHALRVMLPAFEAGFCMSDLVAVAHAGEELGGVVPEEGMTAIATVCSVTINGVLLRNRIPVESRFGGLLEIRDGRPLRFVELVSYAGSSLDPLEIFITSGLTDVREAGTSGSGKVGASFREIPSVSLPHAMELIERMKGYHLNGVIAVGDPSQPLLEISVPLDRVGIVVVGGLTPTAALVEGDVPVTNKAMATALDFKRLQPVWNL
ncbi:MAG: NrpR regulatory domain-containing protein [Armatimonadota bacterium]|jgi:hypothetical protein